MPLTYTIAGKAVTVDENLDLYNAVRNRFIARAEEAVESFRSGQGAFGSIVDFVKNEKGYRYGLTIISSHVDPVVDQLIREHKVFTIDRDSFFSDYFEKYCPWPHYCEQASNAYMRTTMNAKKYQDMLRAPSEEKIEKPRSALDVVSLIEGVLKHGAFNFAGLLMRGTWFATDKALDFARAFYVRAKLGRGTDAFEALAQGIGESVFNLHYMYFDALIAEGAANAASVPYLNPERAKRAAILLGNMGRMEDEDVLARLEDILLGNPYDAKVYDLLKAKLSACGEEIDAVGRYFGAHSALAYCTALPAAETALAPVQEETPADEKKPRKLRAKFTEKIEGRKKEKSEGDEEQTEIVDSLLRLVEMDMITGSAPAKREAARVEKILESHPNYKSDPAEANAVLQELQQITFKSKVGEKYISKITKLADQLDLKSRTFMSAGRKIVFDTPAEARSAKIDDDALSVGYASATRSPAAISGFIEQLGSRRYNKKLRDHYKTALSKHITSQLWISRHKIRFMLQAFKRSGLIFLVLFLMVMYWKYLSSRIMTVVVLVLLALVMLIPLKQLLLMLSAMHYARRLRALEAAEKAALEKLMKNY